MLASPPSRMPGSGPVMDFRVPRSIARHHVLTTVLEASRAASGRSGVGVLTTRTAPSFSAMPRPMPRDPPVISAYFPLSNVAPSCSRVARMNRTTTSSPRAASFRPAAPAGGPCEARAAVAKNGRTSNVIGRSGALFLLSPRYPTGAVQDPSNEPKGSRKGVLSWVDPRAPWRG
jgi:hypothetical protein